MLITEDTMINYLRIFRCVVSSIQHFAQAQSLSIRLGFCVNTTTLYYLSPIIERCFSFSTGTRTFRQTLFENSVFPMPCVTESSRGGCGGDTNLLR